MSTSNVIDLQDPQVIAEATKALMYDKGLFWSAEPSWRMMNPYIAKQLGVRPAMYGTMATYIGDTEVVVGPAEDEARFWLLARRVALETKWDEGLDIGA